MRLISSRAGVKLVALFAVSALVAAACGDSQDGTQPEPSPPVTEAPAESIPAEETPADDGTTATSAAAAGDEPAPPVVSGPTFRIGMIANITTSNWFAALDTESASQNQAYLTNMKPSLFTLSNPGFVYVSDLGDGPPVGAVAEGDVWTVTQSMVQDRTWSDGAAVTANDLAFYFDIVREFSLGSNHSLAFPPDVLSIEALDDYTVKVTFASPPGLAVWQNGVGFASFVPSHYWGPIVDVARAAAAEVSSTVTDDEAVTALVDASLANDDPDDDLTADDLSQDDIDAYIGSSGAIEGLTVIYAATGQGEPSTGPVIFDQWEIGAFAATVANAAYAGNGDVNTLYADGSFSIVNSGTGKDQLFGGAGSGDIVAQYVEGPFVGEILWIEHSSKDAAYEKLENGDLDFVYDPTGLTTGLRTRLAANNDLSFSVNAAEGFRYMAFNMRKAPMSDLAFRQALAVMIDKEFMAQSVFGGAVIEGYTIIHPDLIAHYNTDVVRPGWADGAPLSEGDRADLAIQILKDAGYTWDVEPIVNRDAEGEFSDMTAGSGLIMPDGAKVPQLELLAPGPGYDPFRSTYSLWVAQWAQDLGIPLQASPSDINAIINAVFPPQTTESALGWDIYMLSWGGGDVSLPGTSQVDFFHSSEDAVTGGGLNAAGYISDEFDAAADAFERAITIEEAQKWTLEMDAILARDLPYVVLFRTLIVEAFQSNVQFPVDTIMGGHQGFPNAWPNAVVVIE